MRLSPFLHHAPAQSKRAQRVFKCLPNPLPRDKRLQKGYLPQQSPFFFFHLAQSCSIPPRSQSHHILVCKTGKFTEVHCLWSLTTFTNLHFPNSHPTLIPIISFLFSEHICLNFYYILTKNSFSHTSLNVLFYFQVYWFPPRCQGLPSLQCLAACIITI